MLEDYKPAVERRWLLLLAGLMWIGVGSMLLAFAVTWLEDENPARLYPLAGAGLLAALLIHHLGFLRVVDKNLGRIMAMEGKRCAFSFISLRSYGMVAVMIGLGILLRHSPIPKPYLAALYIGIGLALVLSTVRYLRALLRTFRATGTG